MTDKASVCRFGEYSIVRSCQTRVIGLDGAHGLALGETMGEARPGMRQARGTLTILALARSPAGRV